MSKFSRMSQTWDKLNVSNLRQIPFGLMKELKSVNALGILSPANIDNRGQELHVF